MPAKIARLDPRPPSGLPEVLAGTVMVLGSLAFRSAKKRRLGGANRILTRQIIEIVFLGLICIAVLAQNNLRCLVVTDPIPNVVIPVWAIGAYLIIVFTPSRASHRE